MKAEAGYIPVPVHRYKVFQNHAFFGGRWPLRELLFRADRLARGHDRVRVQYDAILDRTDGRRGVVLSTLPLIEAYSLAMLELVGFESRGALPRRFAYGLGHSIYACETEQEFVDVHLAAHRRRILRAVRRSA